MSNRSDDLESIPELNLAGGIRGKYYERYMAGSNVVLLEPDVARKFRDAAGINQALRTYLTEHSDVVSEVRTRPDSAHVESDRQAGQWRLEVTEPFVDSLKTLPDSDTVGSVLASMLERVRRQPQAAPLLAGTRIQVVTTPEDSIHGQRVPPLRLLYVLAHSSNRIQILMVQLADSSLDIPGNISTQLQSLLGSGDAAPKDHAG